MSQNLPGCSYPTDFYLFAIAIRSFFVVIATHLLAGGVDTTLSGAPLSTRLFWLCRYYNPINLSWRYYSIFAYRCISKGCWGKRQLAIINHEGHPLMPCVPFLVTERMCSFEVRRLEVTGPLSTQGILTVSAAYQGILGLQYAISTEGIPYLPNMTAPLAILGLFRVIVSKWIANKIQVDPYPYPCSTADLRPLGKMASSFWFSPVGLDSPHSSVGLVPLADAAAHIDGHSQMGLLESGVVGDASGMSTGAVNDACMRPSISEIPTGAVNHDGCSHSSTSGMPTGAVTDACMRACISEVPSSTSASGEVDAAPHQHLTEIKLAQCNSYREPASLSQLHGNTHPCALQSPQFAPGSGFPDIPPSQSAHTDAHEFALSTASNVCDSGPNPQKTASNGGHFGPKEIKVSIKPADCDLKPEEEGGLSSYPTPPNSPDFNASSHPSCLEGALLNEVFQYKSNKIVVAGWSFIIIGLLVLSFLPYKVKVAYKVPSKLLQFSMQLFYQYIAVSQFTFHGVLLSKGVHALGNRMLCFDHWTFKVQTVVFMVLLAFMLVIGIMDFVKHAYYRTCK